MTVTTEAPVDPFAGLAAVKTNKPLRTGTGEKPLPPSIVALITGAELGQTYELTLPSADLVKDFDRLIHRAAERATPRVSVRVGKTAGSADVVYRVTAYTPPKGKAVEALKASA